MSVEFPKQNVLFKNKDDDWGKHCLEGLVQSTQFDSDTYESIIKYYDAANGALHSEDYRYVTNPYQTKKTQENNDRQFPARLRNLDILGNVRDILQGERRKRPFAHNVTSTNEDSIERYEQAAKEFGKQQKKQILINKLNEYGLNEGGEESKPMDDPKAIMEKFQEEWKDERAIQGQHALNYIKEKEEIFDQTQVAWGDYLAVGRAFSYRGIQNNEPVYEIVPPWELDFGGSENVRFVEDCDWAVRRCKMTKAQIVETFWKEIEEEDISVDDLERETGNTLSRSDQYPMLANQFEESLDNTGGEHTVYHCVWKSMKKIGILDYQDEMGRDQKMEVSEDFKPAKTDNITWYWVNEVWEGYKINDDWYLGIQPLPIQRESDYNKAEVKLPYNGVLAVNRGSQNISLIQKGYPYQVLYNIYHYRLEWGIAKNKGKIAMMDISLFPNKDGWSPEDTFYFMDTMNMMLFDGSKAEANNSVMQALKDIDLSFYEFIQSHVDLLNQIRSEWEEMAGISRQRKGDVSPYAGKGATEQAVYNSSTITEEMFAQYESFVRRDLQALLDYSKVAWVDGKRVTYVGNNAIPATYEIDPVEHMESEYGIFINSSSADTQKFNMLQDIIPTMAQQNVSPSIIAEMIDADNFPSLKRKLEKADEEIDKQQKEAQQAEQQQKKAEMKQQQQQREHEAEQNELDRESKEYIEQLKVQADMAKLRETEDRTDVREAEKQAQERAQQIEQQRSEREREREEHKEKLEETQQEREEHIRQDNRERQKLNIELQSNQIDREKIQADLQAKKMELANPTSGEELSKEQKKRKRNMTKNNNS